MQVNMTNMFNLFCIHRLHSLNMQLILLEFGRQTMERKRQQRRRSRRHNQYRRCRLSRPSAKLWFETYLTNQEIPDKFFKRQLRMKRCTFDALLNLLRTQLSRQDTALRDRFLPKRFSLSEFIVWHMDSRTLISAPVSVLVRVRRLRQFKMSLKPCLN